MRGLGGLCRPPPKRKIRKKVFQRNEKKKKEKKKEKKERKKGTMNNVKLLHIKRAVFFQFFNTPVALKNLKKFWPSQEKVEMTPLLRINVRWVRYYTRHLHWRSEQIIKIMPYQVTRQFWTETLLYLYRLPDALVTKFNVFSFRMEPAYLRLLQLRPTNFAVAIWQRFSMSMVEDCRCLR